MYVSTSGCRNPSAQYKVCVFRYPFNATLNFSILSEVVLRLIGTVVLLGRSGKIPVPRIHFNIQPYP
jgi:hypothetical protein